MAPVVIAEAKSALFGGVMTPPGVPSLNTNHPPPGWVFITVVCVPSVMSGPVGFDGAGTSPMFLLGVASVAVELALEACTACTTDAGGMRHAAARDKTANGVKRTKVI